VLDNGSNAATTALALKAEAMLGDEKGICCLAGNCGDLGS